ncbi:hypothetical protein HBHAL_4365 [Halobacillus halophilus DSM 2266]|uniref:Uncharacterized protein n=1 Tax=Halobacillus halophilus (strain ATCC 35676 / DSM 2266 / JCM 20832 / KCTC 3685 / LMG 17431 / NBRC 102448 / NCIMB 2269) TaxID=866895 RepID=I0JRD6_HALH3|nr:hypothetical protein HBHAL_4365 [Halobacillus halophilus DSM 2266]
MNSFHSPFSIMDHQLYFLYPLDTAYMLDPILV